jgi:hypothetical protein
MDIKSPFRIRKGSLSCLTGSGPYMLQLHEFRGPIPSPWPYSLLICHDDICVGNAYFSIIAF